MEVGRKGSICSEVSEEERSYMWQSLSCVSSAVRRQLYAGRSSDSVGSPVPPPPPCCALCRQQADAVSEAARSAVRGAFAELQPALLHAVYRVSGAPRDGERDVPGHDSWQVRLRPPPEDHTCPAPDEGIADDRAGMMAGMSSGSGRTQAARHQTRTIDSIFVAKQESGTSSFPSPTVTAYSLGGRPTVHSLQAEIAGSTLETSGLGPAVRRTVSTTSSRRADRGRGVWGPDAPSVARSSFDTPVPSINTLTIPVSAERCGRALSDHCPSPRMFSHMSRTMTSNQVLQARIEELAQEAIVTSREVDLHSQDMRHPPAPPTPIALRMVGVLGWNLAGCPCASAALRIMARSAIAAALAAFFLVLSFQADLGGVLGGCGGADAAECWEESSLLSEVSLPIGALLIFVLFGLKRNRERLEDTFWLMQGVSSERQYGDWEQRRQRWDAAVFTILWLCSVVSAGLKHGPRKAQARTVFHVLVTALFSAVVLALAYGVARICRSLIIMVDTFCCDVVGAMQLQQVAHVWNLTAAVLRKASADVESSLAVLCIILAISVPLLAADTAMRGMQWEDAAMMMPELCVTCGILYALVLAAMVSERAARVPALINAISFGHNTDRARQQTVDYITSSAAGFYLFDMRLTTERVFKFMYVWCLVVIGVLTRVAAPL